MHKIIYVFSILLLATSNAFANQEIDRAEEIAKNKIEEVEHRKSEVGVATQTLISADEMNKILFDSIKNDNDLTGDKK